jgi:hypothetical protein
MVIDPTDLQTRDANGIGVIHLPSSQQCFDSDEQLPEGKRFSQIIIRSCFEVFHLIVHRITGCQYDDWHSGIMPSQPRNEFGSAQSRKHQINDEKVIWGFQSHFEAGSAVPRVVYCKLFRFESERHKAYNFFFVFNN